ncbi:MAG: hypothetical protein R3C11_23165 [Planctomycetaceae bacterium]
MSPNDLTIMQDGTLFIISELGRRKREHLAIDLDGSVHAVAENMGTSNGINLSRWQTVVCE